MNDDELRAAYGARASAPRDEDRADCPSPEELQALVDRTLPESERVRLVRHVAGCTRCRGEIELLRSFAETAERLTPRPAQRGRWAAVGTSLVGALGLALLIQSQCASAISPSPGIRAPVLTSGRGRD